MKKINTLIYAILALIAIVIALFLLTKEAKAETVGEITIEYIPFTKETIKSKEISFEIGDTLSMLIKENFEDVVFQDSEFGPFLLEIEGYVTPDNFETYISIYVNGEYSLVGIQDIELVDGLVVTLKIESYA